MTTYLIVDCETTSLDPSENGRVTCISTYNFDTKKTLSFWGPDEAKIIGDFWTYVEDLKYPTLVTFNGDSFDIPYLIHRSIVTGQKVAKYNRLDLRLIVNSYFTSYNRQVKGSLKYWATVLGIDQHTPPGSQMISLFLEQKYDEIKCHCEEDILITQKLFERLNVCGLIGNGYGNQNAHGKY